MNRLRSSKVTGKMAFVASLCLILAGLLVLAMLSGTAAYATSGLQSVPVVPMLTTTSTATPACTTYSVALTSGATIVPGTTDTGNHCNSCGTDIILPFPVTLYGQTFNAAQVGSNGYLAFGTPDNSSNIPCYPWTGT
jgi:hypothetical protein